MSSVANKSSREVQHQMLASKIELLPTASLRGYERNARIHSDAQISKLAGVIRRAGFLVPIIVDSDRCIVAGHGRVAAAKKLGLQQVPIITADHMSPAEVRAFRLADNKLHDLSTFDTKLVGLELKELGGLDLDILDYTGFEIGEIDVHIGSIDDEIDNDAEHLASAEKGPSVARLGDLFRCGDHFLLCGSSLEESSYARVLQGRKSVANFADPPFNVKVSNVVGLGRKKHREFAQASGEMSEAEFVDFLATYLTLTRDHSQPGAIHYVCMDAAHTFEVLTAARRSGLNFKTTCTWAKTNAGMGSFYRQQTEFVHVFKNGKDAIPHINNIQLGVNGRHRSTLWTYAGSNTFRKGRMDDPTDHPTVKPWALVADAIKDCTRRSDLVLDAFFGSGSTMVAAEKSGRIAAGIEIDPHYVDVAIRRWQRMTGRKAVKVDTNQTFEELERAAAVGQTATWETTDE